VLAPGAIAGNFTATVLANTSQRVTAVASRSAERAARFAAWHGIDRAYGSYEQLAADPEVDIVYVAAPHAEHRALSLLAISAGKHVLIEKPIAVSAVEAEEIAAASRSAGVLAAEAMWTRYIPQFDNLHQVLGRGDLGQVRLATADVGWRTRPDASARFFDPAQGGAALDMGVYGYWAGETREWRDTSGLTGRAWLAWQASALALFAAEGTRDSPLHSLDDAISVMRTIDAVRRLLREAHAGVS
jgi:predicted dehydrogenase